MILAGAFRQVAGVVSPYIFGSPDPAQDEEGFPAISAEVQQKVEAIASKNRATYSQLLQYHASKVAQAPRGQSVKVGEKTVLGTIDQFRTSCSSFFSDNAILYLDCSDTHLSDEYLNAIVTNWPQLKENASGCILNIQKCNQLTADCLNELAAKDPAPDDGKDTIVRYPGLAHLIFIDNPFTESPTKEQCEIFLRFYDLSSTPTDTITSAHLNEWLEIAFRGKIPDLESLQLLFAKYPVSKVDLQGSEFKPQILRMLLLAHTEITDLNLARTMVDCTTSRGVAVSELEIFTILKDAENLQRIDVTGAQWMSGVIYKSRATAPAAPIILDWSVVKEYEAVFTKVVFSLQDSDGKSCTFEEIQDWVKHIMSSSEKLLDRAAYCFFQRFPDLETVVIKDPVASRNYLAALQNALSPQKITDEQVAAVFRAMDQLPEDRKLCVDLLGCTGLTWKSVGEIATRLAPGSEDSSRLSGVRIKGNWLKSANLQQMQILKSVIRLENPPENSVTFAQITEWLEMHSDQMTITAVLESFRECYPNVVDFDLQNSKISQVLLSEIVSVFADTIQSIDLRGSSILKDKDLDWSVLTPLAALTTPPKIIITPGGEWTKEISSCNITKFESTRPALVKLDFSLNRAEETSCTLEEIYRWHQLLGGALGRFRDHCELFFAKFPYIATLDCSTYRTSNAHVEAVLKHWNFGKTDSSPSGTLILTSPYGFDEKIFPKVVEHAPHLKNLIVDEVDGRVYFAIVHIAERTAITALTNCLSITNPPENNTATYDQLKRWEKLVVEPSQPESVPRFSHCCERFFTRYKGEEISTLDLSGSNVTDLELNAILANYRKTYPNTALTLRLEGCKKLTPTSFDYIREQCVKGSNITAKSISIGADDALTKTMGGGNALTFWPVLDLGLGITDTVSYTHLQKWAQAMHKNTMWGESCRRFFERFPSARTLDLQGSVINQEQFVEMSNEWGKHLKTNDRISLNLTACPNLDGTVLTAFFTNHGGKISTLSLSKNGWVDDPMIATVIDFPNLRLLEIEGCNNVSLTSRGLCEPLLRPEDVSEELAATAAKFEVTYKRREYVLYRDLAPFFARGITDAAKRSCIDFFLQHPKLNRFDFSSTDVDTATFRAILEAYKVARGIWEGITFKDPAVDERKGWVNFAAGVALFLDSTPNLTPEVFSIIAENLPQLSGLSLNHNQWVVSYGLEKVDRVFIDRAREEVEAAEKVFTDGGETLANWQAQLNWFQGGVSQHEQEYDKVNPVAGEQSPALVKARADAKTAYVISKGGDYEGLERSKAALAAFKQKFFHSAEYLRITSSYNRIPVEVLGCKNLPPDVIKKFQYLELENPYWTTPVENDHILLFSQISHSSFAPLSPLQQATVLFSLFKTFQTDLLRPLQELTIGKLAINEDVFARYFKALLPFQLDIWHEVIITDEMKAALKNENFDSKNPQHVKALINFIGEVVKKIEVRSIPSDRALKSGKPAPPNAQTLHLSLDRNNDFEGEFALMLSALEKAIEIAIFLNEALSAKVNTRVLGKKLMQSIALLNPADNWTLPLAFVEKIAARCSFPLVQPDPSFTSAHTADKISFVKWLVKERFDETEFSKGIFIDRWANRWLDTIDALGEELLQASTFRLNFANFAAKKAWFNAWVAKWHEMTARCGVSLPSMPDNFANEGELSRYLPTLMGQCSEQIAKIHKQWNQERSLLFGDAPVATVVDQYGAVNSLRVDRSEIRLWQLEMILKNWMKHLSIDVRAGDELEQESAKYQMRNIEGGAVAPGSLRNARQVMQRTETTLDLSYTPFLTADGVLDIFDRVLGPEKYQFTDLIVDGNGWVTDRFRMKVATYCGNLSIEHCHNCNESPQRLDENPTSYHLARIRKHVAPGSNVGERLKNLISGAHPPTEISCCGTDISPEEFGLLVQGIDPKSSLFTKYKLPFDLSNCVLLTSSAMSAFAHIPGFVKSLDLGGNLWVDRKTLENVALHCTMLEQINLTQCPNLSMENIEEFLVEFFEKAKQEVLEKMGIGQFTPEDLDRRPLPAILPDGTLEGFQKNCKELKIVIATEMNGSEPLFVTVSCGQTYEEKLKAARSTGYFF